MPYVHTGEDVQSALAELLSEVQMFTAPVEHRLLARRRFLLRTSEALGDQAALEALLEVLLEVLWPEAEPTRPRWSG